MFRTASTSSTEAPPSLQPMRYSCRDTFCARSPSLRSVSRAPQQCEARNQPAYQEHRQRPPGPAESASGLRRAVVAVKLVAPIVPCAAGILSIHDAPAVS